MVNFLLYHEFRNKQRLRAQRGATRIMIRRNIVILTRTDLSHATARPPLRPKPRKNALPLKAPSTLPIVPAIISICPTPNDSSTEKRKHGDALTVPFVCAHETSEMFAQLVRGPINIVLRKNFSSFIWLGLLLPFFGKRNGCDEMWSDVFSELSDVVYRIRGRVERN